MYGNNFVLTILKNNLPQKEMKGQVSLPFDTEYKIRVKNKNNRQALAKVFIDGIQVCGLGDFVVGANSCLDLSRFVNTSLTKGRKFKFVSLNNSEVEDPTSSDNGIIKVEFRLEKQTPSICFNWDIDFTKNSFNKGFKGTGDNTLYRNSTYTDSNTYTVNYCASDLSKPSSQPGATIGGDISKQQFYYADDFDTEDTPTILTLKLVSSGDLNNKKEAPTIKISRDVHCTTCGKKVKARHTYCFSCGSKLG